MNHEDALLADKKRDVAGIILMSLWISTHPPLPHS